MTYQPPVTLSISHDPVTLWESYSKDLRAMELGAPVAFETIRWKERSEDGYWRCKAKVIGDEKFMEDMFINGLGRHAEVRAPDGERIVWEGKLFKISLDYGSELISVDIRDIFNALWIRYRVTGLTDTLRSTVYENATSIARFSRKEYVLNFGELPNAAVADQCAQVFLDMIQTPKPYQEHRDNQVLHAPFLVLEFHGYCDTWDWLVYNQTILTDFYSVSELLEDVASTLTYVKHIKVDANSTSVQQQFDIDRRCGDIIRGCGKMGDPNLRRWLPRMEEDRTFVFKKAALPTLPPT